MSLKAFILGYNDSFQVASVLETAYDQLLKMLISRQIKRGASDNNMALFLFGFLLLLFNLFLN